MTTVHEWPAQCNISFVYKEKAGAFPHAFGDFKWHGRARALTCRNVTGARCVQGGMERSTRVQMESKMPTRRRENVRRQLTAAIRNVV